MYNKAIETYHKLLESTFEKNETLYKNFLPSLFEKKVSYGGRPLCNHLRPQFISSSDYKKINHVSKTISDALVKMTNTLLESSEYQDILGLTTLEREVLKPNPGYEPIGITTRFDSFLTENSYKFVEFNVEVPAGIAYNDVMLENFMELPAMQEFQKYYKVEYFNFRQRMLDELLKAYHQKFNKAKPNIAIIDWDGVSTYNEFVLFRDFIISKGFNCIIDDPRRLHYENGKLLAGDYEIDIVYKRVVSHEFLQKFDEVQAMWNAYKDGNVCVVNSFRTKLFHKKAIFCLLTDDSYDFGFTKEQTEILHKHLPWTRKVVSGKTKYEGKEVDLLTFASENKHKLVLKPNDDYGGRGIFIGWEDEKWDEHLEFALKNCDYLLQEKVETPRDKFPSLYEGKIHYEDLIVDLDPYIFCGEVVGFLTRLSAGSLCNVTSGGGSVPSFIISER
ncbi:hypothetical protein IT568_12065 [bacterium]|nr:hypothetical protein [bacterium]